MESKSELSKLKSELKKHKAIESELAGRLAGVQKSIEGLALNLAKDEVSIILDLIDKFGKEFTSGVIWKSFENIRTHLKALREYESGYEKLYQNINPYGKDRDKDVKYLVSFLLSYWTPDANLWDILKRIYDTRYEAGNFFIKTQEKEK